MKEHLALFRPRQGAVSTTLKPRRNNWLLAVCIAMAAPAWPAAAQSPPAAEQDQLALEAALQLYSARLLQTAQGRRSYPAAALEQNLSGSVQIEISISSDGKLKAKELVVSSNHRALDQHALQLMELAVPLTEIPSALKGRAFRVPVSVRYVIPE